jgi:hypothetical protein
MEGVHALTGVFAMLIFWGAIAAIFLVPGYLRIRDREQARKMLHETLRMAYEKGQPVPPELIDALQGSSERVVNLPTPQRDLRRAILFIAIGLGFVGLGAGLDYGISFASDVGGAITGGSVAGFGAIPLFIGVAYFVLWLAKSGSAKV